MKKTIIAICLVFVLVVSIGVVVVSAKNQDEKQSKEFKLPKNAVEVSKGVFYLGKAIDKGKVVEGYAFMMKDSQDKKARKPKPPILPKNSFCYGFLSKGAKWKSVEDYIVNPSNSDGLDTTFVTNNLAGNIVKWENAASYDILGTGSFTTETLAADFYTTDNKNEVYFDDLGASDTIAFTVVWGIFGGPTGKRELVEWDMVFNDNYLWSVNAEDSTTEMDFENIATHELGHAVGLDDLYATECSDQTMYGYSWEGDISKRDLANGDIAGIQILY